MTVEGASILGLKGNHLSVQVQLAAVANSPLHIHVGAHTHTHAQITYMAFDIIKLSFLPCTKPAVDIASGMLSSSADSGIPVSSIAESPSTFPGTALLPTTPAVGRAGAAGILTGTHLLTDCSRAQSIARKTEP